MPRLAPLACSLVAAVLLSSPALAKKELGVNVHQSSTVGMDIARDAGLGWVRIDLDWLSVEDKQGSPDWSVIDAVVDAAKARNLQVLGVIGYGPAWASSGDGKGDGAKNDVPKDGLYAAFVEQVVKRYAGRITHYELWNEPNLGDFFEGTPQLYIDRVLKPGAAALHKACGGCKVVAPGLASIGDEYGAWMDAVLAAAKGDIDIVSGHIYAGFPVDSPNSGKTSDSFFNKLESHRILKVGDTVVYEGSRSFKEVMDKHGVSKPFWLTETGKQAKLGDGAEEEAQRLYYQRTLEAMLARPWWEATLFYEAFDEAATPQYTWGLGLHDESAPGGYKAKPVLGFLKQVTQSQPAFGGSKTDCADGLDNDGDGKRDGDDKDCGPGSSSEGIAAAGQGGSAGNGAAGTGEGGAAGTGGAAGKEGTGLRNDLEQNAAPSDDGGCAQGRGSAGGGLALALSLVMAAWRAKRRPV